MFISHSVDQFLFFFGSTSFYLFLLAILILNFDKEYYSRALGIVIFGVCFNNVLKNIWRVPLANPDLLGYALPSGHTFLLILVCYLVLRRHPKIWLHVLIISYIIIYLNMMVIYKYHLWPDIYAGIVAALLFGIVMEWSIIRKQCPLPRLYNSLLIILPVTYIILDHSGEKSYFYMLQYYAMAFWLAICHKMFANNDHNLNRAIRFINFTLLLLVMTLITKWVRAESYVLRLAAPTIYALSISWLIPLTSRKLLAVYRS